MSIPNPLPPHLASLNSEDFMRLREVTPGSVYSYVGHVHADLAGEFAAIDHNHDLDYSDIAHTHDFSLTYAALDHNHDLDYSDIAHTHDYSLVYAPVTHNHEATMDITANRPTSPFIGQMFFDTTLAVDGKPIWFNGTNWVDATGTIS